MIDPNSDTWRTLDAWIAKEIHALQIKLEDALPIDRTNEARAKLRLLRQIRELPTARPDTLEAEAGFGISHPEV
jgi:hypothetical protein